MRYALEDTKPGIFLFLFCILVIKRATLFHLTLPVACCLYTGPEAIEASKTVSQTKHFLPVSSLSVGLYRDRKRVKTHKKLLLPIPKKKERGGGKKKAEH